MLGARHFTTAAESALPRAATCRGHRRRWLAVIAVRCKKIDAVGTLAKAVEAGARFAPNTIDQSGQWPAIARTFAGWPVSSSLIARCSRADTEEINKSSCDAARAML